MQVVERRRDSRIRDCSVDHCSFFFFQAEDGIRDVAVTGVQTCALPISLTVGYLAGLKLTAALASLGIGGLALAFSSQKTLENLFGGISIISDRPMRIGDICKFGDVFGRSEEHTSELQSRLHLVCRLLLEKKKT